MVKETDEDSFPVYRYTRKENEPYSYITSLSGDEVIKGDKGEQSISGKVRVDGTTISLQSEQLLLEMMHL